MPAHGPPRARVIGAMAQLADVLDYHLDTVSVALGQMAAGEIRWQAIIDLQGSALDEFARLAAPANP